MEDKAEDKESDDSTHSSNKTLVVINPESRFDEDESDDDAVKKASPPAAVKLESAVSLWLRFCRT